MSALSPFTWKPYLFSPRVPPRVPLKHSAGMLAVAAAALPVRLHLQTRYCQISSCAALEISGERYAIREARGFFWCLPDTVFWWAGRCGLFWNVISPLNGWWDPFWNDCISHLHSLVFHFLVLASHQITIVIEHLLLHPLSPPTIASLLFIQVSITCEWLPSSPP